MKFLLNWKYIFLDSSQEYSKVHSKNDGNVRNHFECIYSAEWNWIHFIEIDFQMNQKRWNDQILFKRHKRTHKKNTIPIIQMTEHQKMVWRRFLPIFNLLLVEKPHHNWFVQHLKAFQFSTSTKCIAIWNHIDEIKVPLFWLRIFNFWVAQRKSVFEMRHFYLWHKFILIL